MLNVLARIKPLIKVTPPLFLEVGQNKYFWQKKFVVQYYVESYGRVLYGKTELRVGIFGIM